MKKILFLSLLISSTNGMAQIISFKGENGYGFKRQNDVIIEAIYEYAFDFSEGRALVKKEGKWGYIDSNNQVVIPFRFEKGSIFKHNKAEVLLNGKHAIIDSAGNYIIPPEYESFTKAYYGYYLHNDGLIGYLADNGNFSIPCKYKDINARQNYANAKRADMKYDVYNHFGLLASGLEKKIVFDRWFDNEQMGVGEINNKKGIVSFEKGWIIDPVFDYIEDNAFQYGERPNSLIMANKDNKGEFKYYVANQNGKILNSIPFDSVKQDFETLDFYLYRNGLVGYCGRNGSPFIEVIYDTLTRYSQGFIASQNGKFGIIDFEQQLIQKFNYDSIVCALKTNAFDDFDRIEYDEYGERIYYEYDASENSHGKCQQIQLIKGKRTGFYFPLSHTFISPKKYQNVIANVEERCFYIKQKHKYGIVSDSYHIEPAYDTIISSRHIEWESTKFPEQFVSGAFWGRKHPYFIPIYNDEREHKAKYEFEEISQLGALHIKNGKSALYSLDKGDLVTDYIFDGYFKGDLTPYYAIVTIDGKFAVYDYDGNELIEPVYDEIQWAGDDRVRVLENKNEKVIYIKSGEEYLWWDD